MKKTLAIIIAALLALVVAAPVFAALPNYADNPVTVANFPVTEGYTVHPILNNENVKFKYVKGGETLEITNAIPAGHVSGNVLPGGETDAFQVFTDGQWYGMNGSSLLLNKTDVSSGSYIEITFHGTAINIGQILIRGNQSNMGVKVVIDSEEIIPSLPNPGGGLDQRLVAPRWLEETGLTDDWHTVKIYSTGTERVPVDFYEVVETEAPSPATGDSLAAVAVVLTLSAAVGTAVVLKKSK